MDCPAGQGLSIVEVIPARLNLLAPHHVFVSDDFRDPWLTLMKILSKLSKLSIIVISSAGNFWNYKTGPANDIRAVSLLGIYVARIGRFSVNREVLMGTYAVSIWVRWGKSKRPFKVGS